MAQVDEATSYTVSQVAKLLHIGTRSVHHWIDSGRLRACQVSSRSLRITKKDLEEFLEWAYTKPEEEAPPDPEEEAKWQALVAEALADESRRNLSIQEMLNLPPPTEEQLARRHAAVARIRALSKKLKIAPLTSEDLIREMKDERMHRARRLANGRSR